MRLAVVVALAILLSGCLGLDPGRKDPPGQADPGDTTAPAPNPTPTPSDPDAAAGPIPMLLSFSYNDCRGYEGQWKLPLDEVQAELPPGYEASATTTPAGTAGTVQYIFLSCGSFDWPGGVIQDVHYGHVAVAIDGDGEVWYKLRMLTGPTLRAVWEAAGYDVRNGSFNMQGADTAVAGLLHPGAQQIDFAGYSASILTTSPGAGGLLAYRHITEVAEGRLDWTGNRTMGAFQSATGVLQVPEDDPFAPLEPLDGVDSVQRVVSDASIGPIDLWLTPS